MAWINVSNYCTNLILKIAGERYRCLALISLNWGNIVGKLLAEQSTPEKYEHHVLFVRVNNPTWMQELILIKTQLVDRMNKSLDLQVNDIIFLSGRKHAKLTR